MSVCERVRVVCLTHKRKAATTGCHIKRNKKYRNKRKAATTGCHMVQCTGLYGYMRRTNRTKGSKIKRVYSNYTIKTPY